MKVKEIRQKSDKELQMILTENREKLRQLRFDLVNKKIKNVKEIGQTKKMIAQILTIFKQREMAK